MIRVAYIITLFSVVVQAVSYIPGCFNVITGIAEKLAVDDGTKKAVLYAKGVSGLTTIHAVVSDCYASNDGTKQAWTDCGYQIGLAAFQGGMSYWAYRTAHVNTKRDGNGTAAFHHFASDMGWQYTAHVLPNVVARSEGDGVNQDGTISLNNLNMFGINDFYHVTTNGTSFIFAVNGTQITLATTLNKLAGSAEIDKRGGDISGWVIGSGRSLKVDANSDGVSTPSNIRNWFNAFWYDGFLEDWSQATWLGISLDEEYDGRDGQFMMRAETIKAQANWETGWNWCFGVHPTNCNANQLTDNGHCTVDGCVVEVGFSSC